VVVDTNILFSALLRSQSTFVDILFTSGHQFYVCELVMVELFKHKEKIVRLSKLSEEDIVRVYHILLRRLTLYKEDLIAPEHRAAAYVLCHSIDASDTPQVALTLERLVMDRRQYAQERTATAGL
jgi:predicted nucleic acid-binding protein